MAKPPDFATEFFTIERTVEVVVNLKVFRIEVMQSSGGDKPFSTRTYEREDIVAQPAYASVGNPERKPETYAAWKSLDLGWTARETAEGALDQALGFLGERFRD
ncbi:hypothetical protein AC629_10875 [Bradyrhizobium sp. NAS80.1]|uniref:hypothetical protein n=1 Tax=Bradyrhizobium sp. NAS80.1 TaxID=1680159 RepID=UPI0009654263|nr:hypothetical protein [Bradyrhizobium sp. NAS80.1]OKO88047.1 hypothetical protein AC629_10875 [Bradyrhizobium sp. NAS80.1]